MCRVTHILKSIFHIGAVISFVKKDFTLDFVNQGKLLVLSFKLHFQITFFVLILFLQSPPRNLKVMQHNRL